MKFFYEIQTPHSPGCGWLRSPHARQTWDHAMAEGTAWVKNHARNGMHCAVRVAVMLDDGEKLDYHSLD